MKIIKYKKVSKGRYKVYVEDGREFLFYEEVILKYDLLIKKEIDSDLLIEMDQYNQEWDVYYTALHLINTRLRSVYELKELLINFSGENTLKLNYKAIN